MDVPPITNPPPSTSSFYHRVANYAVLIFPVAFVINIFASMVVRADPENISGGVRGLLNAISGLLALTALPAGIIALCGIPKYGRKKLLWKGLVGILLPLLFILLAVPAFLKVRERALERAQQSQEAR